MKKEKRQKILIIISGISIIIMFVFLYFIMFYQPDVEVETSSVSGGALNFDQSINLNFDENVLSDSRVQDLKQYGPEQVQVKERGRKADPFEPF